MLQLRLPRAFLLLTAALTVTSVRPEPAVTTAPDPFDRYAAQYQYDAAAPLNAKVVKTSTQGGTQVDEIAFDSINGERVPGYLLLPPSEGKRPVLLVLHGLGGSKEDILKLAPAMSMFGIKYAILALDAQYHGARQKPDVNLFNGDLKRITDAFVQTIVDYRRALDYAATRPELDTSRTGLAGFSMGAIMGTILTAVEPRIKTAALAVGGADWATLLAQSPAAAALRQGHPEVDWQTAEAIFAPIDPLYFAPHLGQRPILLMNAKKDEIIPQASADKLQNAATGQPLVKEWFDSGHMLPPEAVMMRLVTWFAQTL